MVKERPGMNRGEPWKQPGEFIPEGWVPYSEDDKVEEWRVEQLRKAGVPEGAATVLARSKSDLHKMVSAAQDGLSAEGLLAVFS